MYARTLDTDEHSQIDAGGAVYDYCTIHVTYMYMYIAHCTVSSSTRVSIIVARMFVSSSTRVSIIVARVFVSTLEGCCLTWPTLACCCRSRHTPRCPALCTAPSSHWPYSYSSFYCRKHEEHCMKHTCHRTCTNTLIPVYRHRHNLSHTLTHTLSLTHSLSLTQGG